jgi:phosphatidylethanolamine-binding protein (PEBP) family uncharacterized protein
MLRDALLGLSVVVFGSTLLASGCSDDDTSDGVGSGGSGGSGAGVAASGGSAGVAGSAGSGGSAGASDAGAAGDGPASDAGAPGDAGSGSFALSSPAFESEPGCGPGAPAADACGLFPVENTGLGAGTVNVSPEFDWVGAPAGTLSFAIAMHDLVYMPQGEPFTHWVMWNIPGSATGLPAALPRGVSPGVPADDTRQTSFLEDDGFAGSGACGNVYEFVLYALDSATFEPAAPDDPDAVERALDDSDAVLATTTLRARSNPAGPCTVEN